ncbi:hypothetical protein Y027_4258 [Burkholderia pseudomallei TSV5]|nr:hypothetical protein Y027_4258 [Burkholderia pseudomallei TSV5]
MAAAGMKAPCGAERVGTRWTVDIKNILNNKRPRAGIGIFSHFFRICSNRKMKRVLE